MATTGFKEEWMVRFRSVLRKISASACLLSDVINVSGHRLSTAEIEGALQQHPACAEAAVVGVADELTGYAR
jgi:acyl-CoA synthetase (AMP-forming)/AMP-acid ligase II